MKKVSIALISLITALSVYAVTDSVLSTSRSIEHRQAFRERNKMLLDKISDIDDRNIAEHHLESLVIYNYNMAQANSRMGNVAVATLLASILLGVTLLKWNTHISAEAIKRNND